MSDLSVASDCVLSLQDICKLNVLFNLDLFSDHLMSRLPLSIRIRIFKALPIFDRLHYENAKCVKDLDIDDIYPPPENKYFSDSRILCGNIDGIKQKLVECLFLSKYDRNFYTMLVPALKEGCGLDLKETFNLLSSITEDSLVAQNVYGYIKRFLPCIAMTWPAPDIGGYDNYFIVPSRFMDFLNVEEFASSISFMIGNAQKFISYCNLQTVTCSTLSIDSIQLLGSAIWKEYNSIRMSAIVKHQLVSSSTDVPVINPVSPLLQDILASVEHLSIGTIAELEPTADDENLSIDGPYFILNNIIQSHKQPPILKSIHIHGIPQTVIDTVVTIGAFLCRLEDSPVMDRINNRCTAGGDEYSLLISLSKPYYIEELSFAAESGYYDYAVQYMMAKHSAIVSNTVKTIIKHQKASLKRLALKGLGFTYEDFSTSLKCLRHSSIDQNELKIVNCDEYCSLLDSTLVDFVRLPQFEFLELSDSPDNECYPLILAFMTTPTSHEQKLVISLLPNDSKLSISDWSEQYQLPTVLPHSNIHFKSLVLNNNRKSYVIEHLFKHLNISLKSLHFSTALLSDIVADTVNITNLSLMVEDTGLDVAKLDAFICQNTSLQTLELIFNSKTSFETCSVLFSKVNQCLLQLLKENRSLQMISLQEIDLSEYDSLECDDDSLPPASHQSFNFSDWFNSLPIHFDSSNDILFKMVCKPHIFVFFCLAQKLNASLKITSTYGLEPEDLQFNLIPSLEKAFAEPEVKIHSIALNSKLENCKNEFERIAFSVDIVDH